jgi:AcrR family transcriptional regulator
MPSILDLMGRWEPDAQGRLAEAAMELFSERGYEQTTVAEIAERAGLTERTFFRHFGDKREVLFLGSVQFRENFVAAVQDAPQSSTPLEAVAAAAKRAGAVLEERRGRDFARARQLVIAANAELRERELIKLADVAGAMAQALRGRGIEEPDASMTAQLGMAAFRVAFDRWMPIEEERSLSELIDEALASVVPLAA